MQHVNWDTKPAVHWVCCGCCVPLVTVLFVLDGARVQQHQTVAALVPTVRVAVPYERLRQKLCPTKWAFPQQLQTTSSPLFLRQYPEWQRYSQSRPWLRHWPQSLLLVLTSVILVLVLWPTFPVSQHLPVLCRSIHPHPIIMEVYSPTGISHRLIPTFLDELFPHPQCRWLMVWDLKLCLQWSRIPALHPP